MRAVVQRVKGASVEVEGTVVGAIEGGLLVLLAVEGSDGQEEVEWMARKLAGLRIFNDSEGKMNLSVEDVEGEILLVSQFTLYGDCRKGNRPSFVRSAGPDRAEALYHAVGGALKSRGIRVAWGKFQAKMSVDLVNDGPVTLIVDSNRDFY